MILELLIKYRLAVWDCHLNYAAKLEKQLFELTNKTIKELHEEYNLK